MLRLNVSMSAKICAVNSVILWCLRWSCFGWCIANQKYIMLSSLDLIPISLLNSIGPIFAFIIRLSKTPRNFGIYFTNVFVDAPRSFGMKHSVDARRNFLPVMAVCERKPEYGANVRPFDNLAKASCCTPAAPTRLLCWLKLAEKSR